MAALAEVLQTAFEPLYSNQPSSSSSSLSSTIASIWSKLEVSLPDRPLENTNTTVEASEEQSEEEKRAEEARLAEVKRSTFKTTELLRMALDILGKNMVVQPILKHEIRDESVIGYRLDVLLTIYEVAYSHYPLIPLLEPGAVFIPILDELAEVSSTDQWRTLWPTVEQLGPRFVQNMPQSKGKALPLLRFLNHFQRSLSRTPEDLVFRGRIQSWAVTAFPLADKSAVNLRGDYNALKTTWEEQKPDDKEEAVDAAGDVEMKDETKGESEAKVSADEQSDTKAMNEFYESLWSIQHYFASPPLLGRPAPSPGASTPYDDFVAKSELILPKLFAETDKEVEMAKSEKATIGQKRKRQDDVGTQFTPRYLTARRLFEQELADPSFRRQILTQYCILFQFLLNLTPGSKGKQFYTGGMPKDFTITDEREKWVKGKIFAIREDLKKNTLDGTRYEETLLSMIVHERHQAGWKNDSCPPATFDKEPLGEDTLDQALSGWKTMGEPLRTKRIPYGNRAIASARAIGERRRNIIDCLPLKDWLELAEEKEEVKARWTEEDSAENEGHRELPNWRALRLAARSNISEFAAIANDRDVRLLKEALFPSEKAEDVEMKEEEAEADDEGQAKEAETAGTEEGDQVMGSRHTTPTVQGEETKSEEVPEETSKPQIEDEAMPSGGTSPGKNVGENEVAGNEEVEEAVEVAAEAAVAQEGASST